MVCPRHGVCVLAMLTGAGVHSDRLQSARAQTTQGEAITTDSLKLQAQELKQNLEDGSLMLADLRAMRLRLALHGAAANELGAKIKLIEQRRAIDKNEPSLTQGLLPIADKLINELDQPHWGLAPRYAEQLAQQVHAQYEEYVRKGVVSGQTGDVDEAYFTASQQLSQCLLQGDIPKAVILAAQLQSVEEKLLNTKHPLSISSQNTYNINDAFGRAAFLRKDYLAAGDYLLKAGETPGKFPALRSFGPDMWLAQALLKTGHKDFVLTFLESCKGFWDTPSLNQWIAVLRDGGEPDLRKQVFSKEPIT